MRKLSDHVGRHDHRVPAVHLTAVLHGVVFAPGGNSYVSEQGANAIARLNPRTGQVTDNTVPTLNSGPRSGALGPDGAIWFVERNADKDRTHDP